ncbi:MAG TPA: hypothetical protein VJC39_02740 [Candidatus Nanoarchaeia archaeon]|nr:hypothetical protein [Candidatus Nanoarchaeia archaeon]
MIYLPKLLFFKLLHNKIYLSNALFYDHPYLSVEYLEIVSANLPEGGLIYSVKMTRGQVYTPPSTKIDIELTKIANLKIQIIRC